MVGYVFGLQFGVWRFPLLSAHLDAGGRTKGVLRKRKQSQKVGRAVPSAPIEFTNTPQIECSLNRHGALGTARPTSRGFGATGPQDTPPFPGIWSFDSHVVSYNLPLCAGICWITGCAFPIRGSQM